MSYFYTVAVGRNPGIYELWAKAEAQVKGYKDAKFKKFKTRAEADQYFMDIVGPSLAEACDEDFVEDDEDLLIVGTCFEDDLCEDEEDHVASQHQTKRSNDGVIKTEGSNDEDVILVEDSLASDSDHESENKKFKKDPGDQGRTYAGCSPLSKFEKHRYQYGSGEKGYGSKSPALKSFGEMAEKRREKKATQPKSNEPKRKFVATHKGEAVTVTTVGPSTTNLGKCAIVYTDGACTSNGRVGAAAGIGVYWGPDDPRNVSEVLSGRSTNNRAEIQAAVRAVQQAKEGGYDSVIIRTDSQFMINSVTKWQKKWQKNGWKLTNGLEVANRVDFEALIEASRGIRVEWEKVRAHCGILGNEEADRLATSAIGTSGRSSHYTSAEVQITAPRKDYTRKFPKKFQSNRIPTTSGVKEERSIICLN